MRSARLNSAIAACLTVVVSALGWLWTRGERVLGHDPFYYLQYAKDFQKAYPQYFGSFWPFGYPLLGAFVAETGLPVYFALVVVSLLAYFAIFVLFLQGADREAASKMSARWLLLAAACAPIVPIQGIGVMSEPLFSACLFGFAFAISRWPSLLAIFASGLLANAAFGTRYVGVFALGILGLASVAAWWHSGDRKVRWALAANLVLAGLIFLGFCAANYFYHGKITGPQPVGSESVLTWPWHFARFGWSLIGAVSSGQIMDRLGGVENPAVFLVGFTVATGALALCVAAWRRRRQVPLAAWLGVVSGVYILTIVTMRSTTFFDSVASPRTSEPAFFGLVYIVAILFGRSRWIAYASTASVVLSLGLAWRGMSDAVVPDVASARAYLAEHLQPGEIVSVNQQGRRLAAYFGNDFVEGDLEFPEVYPWDPAAAAYTVVIWRRDPSRAAAEQALWSESITRAVAAGQVETVLEDRSALVLRRTMKSPVE